MRTPGWYYDLNWAEMNDPIYWDGEDVSPMMCGPFKTKKAAYLDQAKNHRHDIMESRQCAKWCEQKAKELK